MLHKPVIFLAILLTLLATTSAWSEEWRFDGVERVVAIPDVHGAYDAMVETLQNADILDQDIAWAGEGAHLVVVGDMLDRGPKSRAVMDLMMRLEDEAKAVGGQVHVLLGNHEMMRLTGDMRYVSAAEYAAFAAEENSAERSRWFALYVERRGGDADALRGEFEKNFPPGYFAMRRAFRADGQYGQWLLQKNVIEVINDTAFVHGGLPPLVAEIGLDGINGKLKRELVDYVENLGVLTDAEVLLPTDSYYDYDALLKNYLPALTEEPETLRAIDAASRLGDSALLSTDGPLWYRNNILCPGIVEEYRLEAALDAIAARRVVVGHTPTPGRQVQQRFGGRLIELDTGMLKYYKGSGNALVLEGDSLSIINQSGVTSVNVLRQPRDVGHRPDNLSTQQLEELLKHGNVLSVEKDSSTAVARTLVKISNGEQTVSALFMKPKGRGFYPNVAAYRLDRLLQLEMVPVTVLRKIDGKLGSVQFLPENTIDEAERSATGQGGSAWCSVGEQWPAMYVFDVLIHNDGRSQGRMLYDKSSWHLILSEHERAFSSKKGRPAHLKNVALAVSPGWKVALTALSDELLKTTFSDVLDKRRLRALEARRDKLLATQ